MDEEDFDFAGPGNSRSRLSSLFQSENPSGDVNQALIFTAPKQPKKNGNTQVTTGTLKLIHAVVVHTYKLKDGNYTNQGKLGCAVLGHHETFTYKLLLYKGKQIQVAVVSITPNFIFHVQPNNYANFYDEKKENWSINFDSESALFDFTKQVTLAKANSQGKSPNSLVIQDLIKGEGQPLENGDVAEVKYTGWLLSNFAFGQVFDSNVDSDSLFRVRLGKGKVIKGWNEGMIGMQKGGRRLLIIPSPLAYGSEGIGSTVPPNSTLIFEIQVIKIKFARESSHSPSPVKVSDSAVDKKPEVPPRQSFSQEDNIRMRGASISEQLSQSPKRDKAQLISRMAKMGTATLPFQGAVPAQVSSDSESEAEVHQPSSPAVQNISRTSSPKAFTKPRSRTNSGPMVSSQHTQPQPIPDSMPFHIGQTSSPISLYSQSNISSHQPFVCAATPFPTYQHPMPGQFSVPQSPYSVQSVPGMIPSVPTSIADSHLSLLITETRSQNTEIRLGLSKITDKVDTVIQKVDDFRLQGRAVSTNMPYLESSVILQNIERIIQENTRLKDDIEAKGSKIQSLNEIICDLIHRNPRFTEESSGILEQKNEALRVASTQSLEKISSLEEEKSKLQSELSTATDKLNTLETDVIKFRKLENELNQKLLDVQKETKQQEAVLNETKERVNENQALINSLEEKLKALEHERDLLIMKLQSVEKEYTQAQGSSDLVEIYKKEIQEHKEKIEELSSIINDSVSSAKLEEEKQKIRVELAKNMESKIETKVKEMRGEVAESQEQLKSSYEDKIRRLESEIENFHLLKRKHEVFQEKTRILKETYEKRMVELMNEVKHLKSMKSGTSPEFSVEIKRVMNRLYKLLQGKFDPDTPYSGSNVLETVLQTIMGLTFQILENKPQSSGEQSESSKKEVLQNEKISEESQFNQQNGMSDRKTEMPAVDVVNSDLPTAKVQADWDLEMQSDDAEESKESVTAEMEKETGSNNEAVGLTETKDEPTLQMDEPIKRESPEHQPASNLFSELLSGTEGTKMCRPQPPPFLDDDEDEDEDDDWLK